MGLSGRRHTVLTTTPYFAGSGHNGDVTILPSPTNLTPLPGQPPEVPWPTDTWTQGPLPAEVDGAELERLLDRAFGSTPDPGFGESHATIVVHRGRVVAERYGPGVDETTPLLSWSMAKSITHALVGILVDQGRLDFHAPAPVAEWANADDPRRHITLDHLLRMVDGLDFNETYSLSADAATTDEDWSHCIDMLFGEGTDAPARYAAARPLRHEPGTVFNYSSGTSNIVARIVCDLIGRGDDATAWMREHLFDPIGMTSATPTYDTEGNFVGSSYFHATARDWARFGLLHLRGGSWDGRQIVPRSWVDYGRATRAVDDEARRYGAHWWTIDDGRGRFYASGFEWQRVMCVPSSDLVAVRLGKTPEADYPTPLAWFEDIISLFD